MKKSQVLAALALAFALGVAVIPTASTYATIIDAPGEAEANSVYSDANVALAKAAQLEHYGDYKALYEGINKKDTGVSAVYKAVSDEYVKLFNENFTIYGTGSVNEKISLANDIASTISLKDEYLKNDVVKNDTAALNQLTTITKVKTLKQAYDSNESTYKAAKRNRDVLVNNYNGGKTQVSKAIAYYESIMWNLEPAAGQAGSGWWKNRLETALDAANTSAYNAFLNAGTTDSVKSIESIDKNAYDSMIDNDAWTTPSASPTPFELAADYGLIVETAKKLPKYNFVEAVANAEAQVNQIKRDSGTDVSYNKAQEYIANLNKAINAYKTGKPADNGNQGDGTHTDDNKNDQNAPDTGILANAEGSASTTVAMVAGIATALTAAGAGVVAYRNARRSSRK